MQHFFDRLTELLGHEPTGKFFTHFIEEFGLKSSAESMGEAKHIVSLPDVGVRLLAFDKVFDTVIIDLRHNSATDKYFSCLMHGVIASDNRADVHAKLSTNSVRHLTNVNGAPTCRYEIPPLSFTFDYEERTGQIDLIAISKM
jgi:hypothetical protein